MLSRRDHSRLGMTGRRATAQLLEESFLGFTPIFVGDAAFHWAYRLAGLVSVEADTFGA